MNSLVLRKTWPCCLLMFDLPETTGLSAVPVFP